MTRPDFKNMIFNFWTDDINNLVDNILVNSRPTYPVAPAIAIFKESFMLLIIPVIISKIYCNEELTF